MGGKCFLKVNENVPQKYSPSMQIDAFLIREMHPIAEYQFCDLSFAC